MHFNIERTVTRFIFSVLLLVIGTLLFYSQSELVIVASADQVPGLTDNFDKGWHFIAEEDLQPVGEVTSIPQLVLSVTASPTTTMLIGDQVMITVHIANQGDAILTDYGLSIYVPPGLLVSHLPTEGLVFNESSRLLNVETPDLLPAQQIDRHFQVVVQADATDHLVIVAAAGGIHLRSTAQAQIELLVTDANSVSTTIMGQYAIEEGGWTPRFNHATVSSFSGAAVYQYPMDLPPGRNGLQPSVALSYNSKRVDGITSWQSSEWVGLGWNIDSIDITRSNFRELWQGNTDWLTYDNEFQLIFNGTAYRLIPANPTQLSGRYYAEGFPDLYIELINDCSDGDCNNGQGGSSVNRTTEYWVVKTSTGTIYRLGYKGHSEQVVFRTSNLASHGTDHPLSPYSGPVAEHTAFRWRVDLVTDVYGNHMGAFHLL